MWRQKWLLLEQNITSTDPSHTHLPHNHCNCLPTVLTHSSPAAIQAPFSFLDQIQRKTQCCCRWNQNCCKKLEPQKRNTTQYKLLWGDCVASPMMNMHTAGVFFPNVYSYSTLTTNSASVSNFNHDVNLFPVTPYWPPSLIPSSIIFSWDCFPFFVAVIVVDDDVPSADNLTWENKLTLKPQMKPIVQLNFHLSRFHLLNHYFRLNRTWMHLFLV